MRPGDLYTLTWQELNLTFRRLVKIPEKTIHHKNPAKLDLPLNDDIYNVMALWHTQQGCPADGLVFPSTVTGKPFDKQAHRKAWRRVTVLGGVDPDLHFYSLRHHFISALVASGAPLLAVAKLVGHKSATMIEQHYGHLAQSTAADLMRSFSESLKATATENRGIA
jgi:integrase